ncbi:TIGR02186 family protein [Plastoroseomonas arctica]|uniref:Transmembrane protein n=1 Tax=Plastoroseomonas arctica TaxID=1509237 RepID=A0AAF1KUX1_9PROT|nr:TIGR02186 family protein [Plastoroseomonas arctica]MBR0657327.1 hypothetical protein [Plastoroseomonas arctica]
MLACFLLLAIAPARAQLVDTARPNLAAQISTRIVEVTTGFTGAEILVFGAAERPLGGEAGDQVLVTVRGPRTPQVVRRRVEFFGIWVNGPSARFLDVPGFYAIAGTRPVWEVLPEEARAEGMLGLDTLPLAARGAQEPSFRAALLALKQADGRWQEHAVPVEVSGGRLFLARIPLPATVPTGPYLVEVLLVRERRVVAQQTLNLEVRRVGTAAWISAVARQAPLLYGVACILLASLAGWLGSVLFRRS